MTKAHDPGTQRAFPPIQKGQLRYLLYRPSAVDELPEKKWPVICFLHGIGEAAKNSDETEQSLYALLRHGTPPWHAEINSPLIQEFIVFSPQLPERRYWAKRDFEEITQIVEIIYKRLRGDRERSYLTGFSIGGKGVFDFAAWGGKWAALWPVDDAHGRARESCDTQRIWLHFGSWKPIPQKATAENLELAEVEPYRGEVSNEDRLYTDYTRFGYDHAGTCVAAYSDWRVYRWLLSS